MSRGWGAGAGGVRKCRADRRLRLGGAEKGANWFPTAPGRLGLGVWRLLRLE
jgi:hypothetical protein